MPSKHVAGVKALNKVYFHSRKIGEMVRFYRAIGFPPIKRFRHDGFEHVQCKAPGFELWILEGEDGQAPKPHGAGSTWIGLEVASLNAVMAAARHAKARVLFTRDTTAERRAVLLDPDGHPVDLTERTTRRRTRQQQNDAASNIPPH